MGLLYKLFGIKPNSIPEFCDAVYKRGLKEVTINIGYKLEPLFDAWTGGADILSVPYIKFEAGKLSFKDYPLPGDGRFAQEFSKEPKRKELSLAVVTLELRDKFVSKGIECKVFQDDKLIDKNKEEEIKKQAKKLNVR